MRQAIKPTRRVVAPAVFAGVLTLALAVPTWAPAHEVVVLTHEIATLDGPVHLYAAPTLTARASAYLPYDERAEILEDRGSWVRVRAATLDGWVRADQLQGRTRVSALPAVPRVAITERMTSPVMIVDGLPLPAVRTVEVVTVESGTVLSHADLRNRPSSVAVNVGNVDAGEPVTVLARDGSWILVRGRDGEEGWVDARNVAGSVAPVIVPRPTWVWLSRSLPLREQPAAWSRSVVAALDGQRLDLVARDGRWVKVRDQHGNTGWIPDDALRARVVGPSDPPVGAQLVLAHSLLVRDRPAAVFTAATRIDDGADVTVVARQGDWIFVRADDGSTGWVSIVELYEAAY